MSAAQLLIAAVGLTASVCTFVLMRFPRHRRAEFRGRAFSIHSSLIGAAIVLAVCVAMVWAQGRYESR